MSGIMMAVLLAIVFMLFDYVTGVLQALKNKNLDSSVMRAGLFHKGSFILVIMLSGLIQCAMMYMPDLGFSVPLVYISCVYISLTEIISIVENLIKINPELADTKIMSIFKITDPDIIERLKNGEIK